MNINIHIDRLILDGLPVDGLDPDALSDNVRLTLEGLLAERGIHEGIATGGAWGSVLGGEIIGTDAHPEGLGSEIAHAIHAGLGAMKEQDHDVIKSARR